MSGRSKKVQIDGNLPSIYGRFEAMVVTSIVSVVPITIFFALADLTIKNGNYKDIVVQSLLIREEQLEQLPQLEKFWLFPEILVNIAYLQFLLLLILTGLLILVGLLRRIIGMIVNHPLTYIGAYFSLILRRIVFFVYSLPSILTGKMRPYMFYTNIAVSTRSLKSIIFKGYWITIVIFVASFQFAGLFYSRTDSYPIFFGYEFTLINTSIVFMTLTGSFWIVFLLSVDLLERFDVRILDINTSRMTNIGKFFSNVSKKALSFLSLSFMIIAIQDFSAQDWVQPIIFLNIFNMFAIWMLLSYEANLELVGDQVRSHLDRRTLTGAERIIITREKEHLGAKKIREAEEQMKKAEQRIKIANEVGFIQSLIESFLLLWLVPLFTIAVLYVDTGRAENPSLSRVLGIEISVAIFVLVMMLVLYAYLTKYEIIRSELIWFPMLYIGNAIANYVDYKSEIENEDIHLATLIGFSLIWFILVARNIYPRMPGREFWKSWHRITFFFIIVAFWILTIWYQIWIDQTYGQ
jgi:hypothetical protein